MNTPYPHTTRSVRQKAGRLVRTAAEHHGVAHVAAMLGVGRPTCHRWATGANIPHAMYVPTILKVLGPKTAVTP